MKKITAFVLSFLVICSCLTACKEDETVDSFLAGGIWEAVLKSSDSTDKGQVIAYKFKEDGTFLFYKNLYIIASGYYKHDEEKEELILSNADHSEEIKCTCKLDEEGILTIKGAVFKTADGDSKEVEIKFSKISEDDEKYYKENATIGYVVEKAD